MLKIGKASPDNREVWDHIINVSPTGTIFHTEDWIEILERSLGLQVTRLVAIEKGEIVGVLPVAANKWPKQWLISNRLPLTVVSPPILSDNPYGGPCALAGRSDAEFELLRYILQKYPAGEIRFSPDLKHNSQLPRIPNHDKIAHFASTSVVDLTSNEDTMWSRCKGNMRTHVRKAKKLGVKIVSSNDQSDIADFYSLLHQTYARSGFSPLHIAFYYQAFNILKNKNRAKLFFAVVDGKRVASEISLIFKDRIYAWTGASNRTFSSYSPNNLLSWEIAKWARDIGLSYYDLCGMGIPSIARFKAGLGGKLYKYPCIMWKNRFYFSVSQIFNRVLRVSRARNDIRN